MKIYSSHGCIFTKNTVVLRYRLLLLLIFSFSTQPSHIFSQTFSSQLYPDSLKKESYFDFHPEKFVNQEMVVDHLARKIDSLHQNGFLTASIDSTKTANSQFKVYAFLGEKYQIKSINNKGIEPSVFSQYFNEKQELSWQDVNRKKSEILEKYVDNGFINASIQLDNINFSKGEISADLNLKRGEQYTLDSISLIGDLSISQEYLEKNLQIPKGSILNQDFFSRLERQIAASRFMELKEPPTFKLLPEGKAIVYLPINEKAANEFDLLIGFLPNPNQILVDRSLLLTGEGRLQLYNPFGTGKEFLVDYKQLQPESPRLVGDLYFPQFLMKEVGIVGSFELFKLDTSFVNLDGKIGFRYDFSSTKNLSLSYRRATSYLQRIDTVSVKQNLELPQSVDYKQNIYQASFEWQAKDYPRNPSKGFGLNITGAIGNREITRNETIVNLYDPSFDFSSLYDGINEKKLLFSGEAKLQYFIPAFKRSTFLLQNHTGLHEVNRYFENDLFRLGGYKTIRGFDEQAYLASSYTINTAEYRFLLSRDSYFSAFADWALIKNKQLLQNQNNELLGIGTGLDLATKAGIFSLNFAIGQDNTSTFDFNRTRMHIGYVNVF